MLGFDAEKNLDAMGTIAKQSLKGDFLELQTADGVDIHLPEVGLGGRSFAFLIDWHIRLILSLAWFMSFGVIFLGAQSIPDFFQDIIGLSLTIPHFGLISGLAS